MRPDCLIILLREGNLTVFSKTTLREVHNLERMYISGEFEKKSDYIAKIY